MNKKVVLCLCCLALPTLAEANPTRIGKYALPTRLADSLRQGLHVSVYLKYADMLATEVPVKQKVANATIVMKDGKLYIQTLEFEDITQETELSDELKARMMALNDHPFDENLHLALADDAEFVLDLHSLYLELTVQKSALGTKRIARSDILKNSTVSDLSSILNYRFGSYYNTNGNNDNSSSYLSLSSLSALGEHHLYLNGSLYGMGTSQQYSELYRALYERDTEGRRFAAGLMDTWSMQSIANFNAINSSKIYGASYGNVSQTIVHDRKQSLTPIILFLPNAGTAHIYRDGRLLSIQNLAMGSQEVDTSTLPYGVYTVEIKTIINGQETNSTTAQINKSRSRTSTDNDKVEWQVFGGMVEYRPSRSYKTSPLDHENNPHNIQDKETWMAGAAVAKNFAWLSGAQFKSSLYGFADTAVTELDSSIYFSQLSNLNVQTMLASDSSMRAISTLNYAFPKNIGNFWLSYDITKLGDQLDIDEQDNMSLGTTLNLQTLSSKLGALTASYSHDHENNNRHTNVEYSQNVYNSRYADVRFRMGLHNYDFNTQDQRDDHYVFIDVSMPIARWFSAGLSSRNRNIMANASMKKTFQDQFITNVGLDVSQAIHTKQNAEGDHQDRLAINGFVGYEAKYNEGSFSAGISGQNQSINYMSQGSVAWTGQHLAMSNLSQDAGVIIHTDLEDKGAMSALINGQNYRLTGKRNFIPLPAYKPYSIELTNAKDTIDSVDIMQGRKNTAVLYPGNIAVIQPSIRQMVTVFGRLHDQAGQVLSQKKISSQLSQAITDEQGEFSIDIDKRHPKISLQYDNGNVCESTLDLKQARGAVWIGDIRCDITKNQTLRTNGGIK